MSDQNKPTTQAQEPAACDGGTCGIGGYCNDCTQPQAQELPDERAGFDIDGTRSFLASWANWKPDPLNDDKHYRGLATALDYLDDLIGPQARAALAAKTIPTLTVEELELCRQWFDCVQDVHSGYLKDYDYALGKKLYEILNMRAPHRVRDAAIAAQGGQ